MFIIIKLKPFKSSKENTSGLDIEAIEESYNLILNLVNFIIYKLYS